MDLLESLHHSPFTIYTMVSYKLSNTHMIYRFLDKDEIKIEDIFSELYEVQNILHSFIPRLQPETNIDLQQKPLLNRRVSFPRRYSLGGTILRFHPPNTAYRSSIPKLAIYQLVTKYYTTKWCDGLIWINPSL